MGVPVARVVDVVVAVIGLALDDDQKGGGGRAICRRHDLQQAAVQAGAEVADAERSVRSVEAKHRATSKVRGIGEMEARQTVEHRAGIDLDEG